jgi:hypothetical protein
MILYLILNDCLRITLPILNRVMLYTGQVTGNGDPGLPGGDPDLPEAPLDSGLYFLIAIVLIYGIYKINTRQSPEGNDCGIIG